MSAPEGQALANVSFTAKPRNNAPAAEVALGRQSRPASEGTRQPRPAEYQRGEIEEARDLRERAQHDERDRRVRVPRVDELHEEGDEEQDRLGIEQADDERPPKGPLLGPGTGRLLDAAPLPVLPRARHIPHAARSIPTASHVRYPAPAYFTTPNSRALPWSREATPAADKVISTESPHHTPAAAVYPARIPRRAATERTYSELGPGSRTIRTRPAR